jgi:hypothetical protein
MGLAPRALAGALLAAAVLPRSALAARIVVLAPSGARDVREVVEIVAATLGEALAESSIETSKRPKTASSRNDPTLPAQRALDNLDADLAVDVTVTGSRSRKVTVLVVSRKVGLVWQQSATGSGKGATNVWRALAGAAANAIRAHLDAQVAAPEVTASTAPPAGPAAPPPAPPDAPESAPASTPAALVFVPASEPAAAVQIETVARPSWSIAFSLGGGVAGFDDRVDTNTRSGDLAVQVGAAPVFLGVIETHIGRFAEVTLAGHLLRTTIHPEVRLAEADAEIEPAKVAATQWGVRLLGGAGWDLSRFRLALHAGVGLDTLTAPVQRVTTPTAGSNVVVIVPSWRRLLPLVGVELGFGFAWIDGLTATIGLLGSPAGMYNETPRTSGRATLVVGGEMRVEARYHFALGGIDRFFLQGELDGELLYVGFTGDGTRVGLVSGRRVSDARERRLAFTTALSMGYNL